VTNLLKCHHKGGGRTLAVTTCASFCSKSTHINKYKGNEIEKTYLVIFVTDSPQANVSASIIDETQPCILSCSVSSKPVSTIVLYRLVNNTEQLVAGTVTKNNTLQYVIDAVSRDDAGTYRCKANNELGSDNKDTHVVVRCKYIYTCFPFYLETI